MNRALQARLWRSLAGLLLLSWLAIGPAHGEERGLLWKIEAPGVAPSYLFGTIHTDDPRVTDFSPALRQALQESRVFMMEVLPPRDLTPILMKQGSLADQLTPQELAQVKSLAETHALSEDIALRMKPWLLASVFSLPRPQSPLTQDILLYGMASGSGKQVLGLEAAAAHFGALDSLSDAEQLSLLRLTLAQSVEEKEQDFELIMQAYRDKEIGRIAAEDEKRLGSLPPELWAKVKTLLLDQRNAAMTEGIVRQVTQASAFIAVGAAHLPGEGGLVARLRQAGYRLSVVE